MRPTWSVALATALVAGAAACASETSTTPTPQILASASASRAFGIWTPSGTDTCSPAIQDQFATIGPDGKKYPTWHPPVDPASGCSFGHEHGRTRADQNCMAWLATCRSHTPTNSSMLQASASSVMRTTLVTKSSGRTICTFDRAAQPAQHLKWFVMCLSNYIKARTRKMHLSTTCTN